MARCSKYTKNGKRCKANAMKNSTMCVFHMKPGARERLSRINREQARGRQYKIRGSTRGGGSRFRKR